MSADSPGSTATKNERHRTSLRKVALLASLCLLFVPGLALWNLAMTKWLHAHNPVPGRFYTVEGRKMHIYCTGQGSPSIVIEAGLGSDWVGWQGVQPRLSELTTVCTYDRSGLGWSEPRSGPRDAQTIVRQLHELLDQAGVHRPLVLTGHSAGGLYIREFAREYPAEVVGAVFVDSTSPAQFEQNAAFRASYEAGKRRAALGLLFEKLLVWSGLERLSGNCRGNAPKDVANMAGQSAAQKCRPGYEGGDVGEYMDLDSSFKQAARLATFGNIPLLILTRDTDVHKPGMKPETITGLQVWEHQQEQFKSLSPLSWRVIARNSGHGIYHDRPDIVIAEISRLILYLRGENAPPFGTTTTE